jgi:hypothetical protein
MDVVVSMLKRARGTCENICSSNRLLTDQF